MFEFLPFKGPERARYVPFQTRLVRDKFYLAETSHMVFPCKSRANQETNDRNTPHLRLTGTNLPRPQASAPSILGISSAPSKSPSRPSGTHKGSRRTVTAPRWLHSSRIGLTHTTTCAVTLGRFRLSKRLPSAITVTFNLFSSIRSWTAGRCSRSMWESFGTIESQPGSERNVR